jgi:hypothetical protein
MIGQKGEVKGRRKTSSHSVPASSFKFASSLLLAIGLVQCNTLKAIYQYTDRLAGLTLGLHTYYHASQHV